jgi:hypothetical protein
MSMAVIIPSRGRPSNIEELLVSWKATHTKADLFIVVDDDDPEIDGYRAFTGLTLLVYPRQGKGMAKPLNRAAWEILTTGDYQYFAFIGDDHRPRTEYWDDKLADALDKIGTGIAYGNDLLQGEGLPTAVAMSADIVQALGGMTPPNMIHLYLDNFWLKLGQDTAIAYLPEIIIEHLHPIAGKAEWDEGYRDVNADDVYSADAKAFKEYIASDAYRQLLDDLLDRA